MLGIEAIKFLYDEIKILNDILRRTLNAKGCVITFLNFRFFKV